MFFSSCKKHFR